MTVRGATFYPRVLNWSDSVVFVLFYMEQNIFDLFIAFKFKYFFIYNVICNIYNIYSITKMYVVTLLLCLN